SSSAAHRRRHSGRAWLRAAPERHGLVANVITCFPCRRICYAAESAQHRLRRESGRGLRGKRALPMDARTRGESVPSCRAARWLRVALDRRDYARGFVRKENLQWLCNRREFEWLAVASGGFGFGRTADRVKRDASVPVGALPSFTGRPPL